MNSTKAMAMGILRALWNDFAQNNGSAQRYVEVPLADTRGKSPAKHNVVPYPPSNLLTIHNYHPMIDHLPADDNRIDFGDQDSAAAKPQIHKIYSHWTDGPNSKEVVSKLPFIVKQPSSAALPPAKVVSVRPLRVRNDLQNETEDSSSSDQKEHEPAVDRPNSDKKKTIVKAPQPKRKTKEPIPNKKNEVIVKKKKTTSPPTGSTATADDHHNHHGRPSSVDDPDLQSDANELLEYSDTADGEDGGAGLDLGEEDYKYDHVKETEEVNSPKDCLLHNGSSAADGQSTSTRRECDDRVSTNPKRPKTKFTDDFFDFGFGDDEGPAQKVHKEVSSSVTRDHVKLKPVKIHVPKVKPPKIKVPKIKVPKTKVKLKDIPSMMAIMKTFFHGVSMATMYNPFNFGLWTVVLHPVTMLLIGVGGFLMYIFPWTSVALLTSRKNDDNAIVVHRFGFADRSRRGKFNSFPHGGHAVIGPPVRSSDWLEGQADWILNLINQYSFNMEL